MTKKYFNDLQTLYEKLELDQKTRDEIELKYFVSGAALYFESTILVSLSPMGLAFKLPDEQVVKLMIEGDAVPLKYFPKGNTKNKYAMFPLPDLEDVKRWEPYFKTAFRKHD